MTPQKTKNHICNKVIGDEDMIYGKDPVFIPIAPVIAHGVVLANRKHHILPKQMKHFLQRLKKLFNHFRCG